MHVENNSALQFEYDISFIIYRIKSVCTHNTYSGDGAITGQGLANTGSVSLYNRAAYSRNLSLSANRAGEWNFLPVITGFSLENSIQTACLSHISVQALKNGALPAEFFLLLASMSIVYVVRYIICVATLSIANCTLWSMDTAECAFSMESALRASLYGHSFAHSSKKFLASILGLRFCIHKKR